jgi:hypothetical protein
LDGISFTRLGGQSMKRADIDYRQAEDGEPLELGEDDPLAPDVDDLEDAAPAMAVSSSPADSNPWTRPATDRPVTDPPVTDPDASRSLADQPAADEDSRP